MKTHIWLGIMIGLSFLSDGAGTALIAQTTSAEATPPPSAPPKRTAADLEKLVGPLALYPDPLIATMLPASVYPLEIVQAARFVADTNNIAKIDEQPWDDNVKAVARVPDAIKKMNDDLPWTIELGEAFLAQDKDVMDAIQSMRGKAQKAGTLQTTPQQIVTVTNMVVMQTNVTQVVTVTNQVVQIQPADPQVVYVPSYNPTTVYYPPPSYVYNPVAPLVTFTGGVAMGAIIANNCDWFHGGCYHGGDVDIDIDRNVNRESNRNVNRNTTRTQQKWQPDQSRLGKSGSPSTQASSREARGWSSGSASTRGASGTRPTTGTAGARPSTGTAGSRPTTGTAANRPSTGTAANRPTTGSSAPRSSASTSQFQDRSSSPSAASQPRTSPSASSRSGGGGGGGSAFSGVSSGGGARASSSRGAASRGGGGGGGRGGGGRR